MNNQHAYPFVTHEVTCFGMTLRDYFAAAFLANKYCAATMSEATAKRAYQIADAMLKARQE